MMWYQKKGSRVFFYTLLLFFLIDILFFRVLPWVLPNESAWSSSPHYNFEYTLKNTMARQPNEKLVFIVGSSVALYSVLPHILEKKLSIEKKSSNKNHRSYRVVMLAHQGMTPFHLKTYLPDILALKPDVIIYATHPVDLRLERPYVHGNAKDFFEPIESVKRKQAYKQYVNSIVASVEFQTLSPLATLQEYFYYLNRNERTSLAVSTLLGAYRYKSIVLPEYSRLLDNHFSKSRHYHSYAGIDVSGITHRGWASKQFSFQISNGVLANGWHVNAPNDLFIKNKNLPLHLKICTTNNYCKKHIVLLKKGWQNIELPVTAAQGSHVFATIESAAYDSRSDDYLSIRFTRNFGRISPAIRSQGRPLRREDTLYLQYSDTAYQKSFSNRLLNFKKQGSEYLKAIKEARQFRSNIAFNATLPVFTQMEKIMQHILKNNTNLLLINTPENPISQKWYRSRTWYNGYLSFLKKNRGNHYQMHDFHNKLPMQDFYDYHHLTYFGSQKISKKVAQILVKYFKPIK